MILFIITSSSSSSGVGDCRQALKEMLEEGRGAYWIDERMHPLQLVR